MFYLAITMPLPEMTVSRPEIFTVHVGAALFAAVCSGVVGYLGALRGAAEKATPSGITPVSGQVPQRSGDAETKMFC